MLVVLFSLTSAFAESLGQLLEHQCPVNEQWVKCEDWVCAPERCDELGFPLACPDFNIRVDITCKDQCRCIPGYLRNDYGFCIPSNLCPSCGGDLNATAGCGIYCGNLCSNYRERDVACPAICYLNGCDCKPGFVFNDIIRKCVFPFDCPPPCNGDYYAEKKDCVSPCQPTCAYPNPGPCTKNCIVDVCQCVDGYILDKEGGKCIRIEYCPDDLGCNGDPNAVITNCGSNCPSTCEQTNQMACAAVCVPGRCACKDGFIISESSGKCIPKTECERCKHGNC